MGYLKMLLFGFLLATLVSAGLIIKHQEQKIDKLTIDLAAANASLLSSKEIIYKMTDSKEINERIGSFIDQGKSIIADEHRALAEELDKKFHDHLLVTQREKICLYECGEYQTDGEACPLPPGFLPNPEVEKIKKDYINNAWKTFCLANRTAEGCQ